MFATIIVSIKFYQESKLNKIYKVSLVSGKERVCNGKKNRKEKNNGKTIFILNVHALTNYI